MNKPFKLLITGRRSGKTLASLAKSFPGTWLTEEEIRNERLFDQESNEIKDLEAYDRLHDQIDR